MGDNSDSDSESYIIPTGGNNKISKLIGGKPSTTYFNDSSSDDDEILSVSDDDDFEGGAASDKDIEEGEIEEGEIDENENIENKIHIFNGYVDNIIMWLYILNENASKKCSSKLTVYFYFTSFEKKLPKTNIDVLDQEHINTEFTKKCPINSEIFFFRK